MLIYMRDYQTFSVKESEAGKRLVNECNDSNSESGKSLLVKLESTHSGLLNGNWRFYRPDRMQDSTHTWVEANKPAKPILIEHDKQGEVLGRVLTAKYLDLSHLYRDSVPEVGNTIFFADATSQKLNLYKSVNVVLDKLQTRKDYKGLGYIELGAKITNPDAIRKILADEYLTVSVGFATDQALCSVCHTDWSVDDRCDHKLGEMVDGRRMFLIAGNMFYKECSFVNFAADPFAQVISKEILKDNLNNQKFLLGLNSTRIDTVMNQYQLMTDSKEAAKLYESDIQILTETDIKDSEMPTDLQTYLDEMNKAPLTKDRATEILTAVQEAPTETDSDKELKRKVLTVLKSHIQQHNLDDVKRDLNKDQVEATIETLIPTLQDMSVDARKIYLARITEEAKQFGLEIPAIDVESLQVSQDKKVEEKKDPAVTNVLIDALHKVEGYVFDDAKIPSDTVACLDSLHSHYAASDEEGKQAMRYGLYSHLSHWRAASEKDYAVDRIKKMESDPDKKDAIEVPVTVMTDAEKKASLMVVGAGLRTEQGKGWVPNGATDSLQSLHKAHVSADSDGKSHISSAAGALLEHWHSGSILDYHKSLMAPGTGQEVKDAIILTKVEYDTITSGVEKLESQLASTKLEIDSVQKQNTILVKNLKKDRAKTLVTIKVLTGEAGYQGLTLDQINDKIDQLAQRNLDSLRDSLEDGLIKLDGFTPAVAVTDTPDGKQIDDKSRLPVQDPPAAGKELNDNQQDVPVKKYPKDPKARAGVLFFEQKMAKLAGKK